MSTPTSVVPSQACEGVFVDGECQCSDGFRGTYCEIEYVELALVLTMSFPENIEEFSNAFEDEVEIALELPGNSVKVISVSIYSSRRLLDNVDDTTSMIIVEFEIEVSGNYEDSVSLIDAMSYQLSDPDSILLSGSLGSSISTEYGLLIISDELLMTDSGTKTSSQAQLTTTVSSSTSITSVHETESITTNVKTSTETESDSTTIVDDFDDLEDSQVTDPYTLTTTLTSNADPFTLDDDFADNAVTPQQESASMLGIIIAIVVVAVILVVVLMYLIVKAIRRRAKLAPSKPYAVATHDLENNARDVESA